jgi:hypothetical protein
VLSIVVEGQAFPHDQSSMGSHCGGAKYELHDLALVTSEDGEDVLGQYTRREKNVGSQ